MLTLMAENCYNYIKCWQAVSGKINQLHPKIGFHSPFLNTTKAKGSYH